MCGSGRVSCGTVSGTEILRCCPFFYLPPQRPASGVPGGIWNCGVGRVGVAGLGGSIATTGGVVPDDLDFCTFSVGVAAGGVARQQHLRYFLRDRDRWFHFEPCGGEGD